MVRRLIQPSDRPVDGRCDPVPLPGALAPADRRQLNAAAGIAHDMHTPVAVILTSSELLLEDLDAADKTKLLASIRRQALRLQCMLEELVRNARVPEGSSPVVRELVDLTLLARELALEYRRFRKDHELVVKASRSALHAQVDPEKVRRILQNLLDNAYQYSPPGTTITLRLFPNRKRQEIILEVEDQGPGISESEELQIFNPFTRLATSTGSGFGLGLYTVRSLAEAHGGRAWLERRHSVGACFRVSLPVFGGESLPSD